MPVASNAGYKMPTIVDTPGTPSNAVARSTVADTADILRVGTGKDGQQLTWRSGLMPASFRGARFHCEMNAIESGRRIVEHQFPKKELPYAEDMGRMAREFTVRGYCIVYPGDKQVNGATDDLFQRDYRLPRDRLKNELEAEGPGDLQLPTQIIQNVVCTRYKLTEEEKLGGYCTFDMTFSEYGLDPLYDPSSDIDSAANVAQAAQALQNQVQRSLAPPSPSIGTGIDV